MTTRHDIYRATEATETIVFKNLTQRRQTLNVSQNVKRLSKSCQDVNQTEVMPLKMNENDSKMTQMTQMTASLKGNNVIQCKVELNSTVNV